MAKKQATKPPEPVLEPTELVVMGRPSSYRPEFTEQTTKLCALGATDEEIADFFEISPRTLNRWKVTRPDFADALRRGKSPADDRVEDSLYHRSLPRHVEEEQAIKVKKITYGNNGKKLLEEEKIEIVTVRKFMPPDTTAMIFWLKNRRSDKWRDVHKVEHGEAGAFDQMGDEELSKYIELEAQELLPAPQLPPPKVKRGATKH